MPFGRWSIASLLASLFNHLAFFCCCFRVTFSNKEYWLFALCKLQERAKHHQTSQKKKKHRPKINSRAIYFTMITDGTVVRSAFFISHWPLFLSPSASHHFVHPQKMSMRTLQRALLHTTVHCTHTAHENRFTMEKISLNRDLVVRKAKSKIDQHGQPALWG